MKPPKLVKPYVISFCRSVVSDPKPVYVPISPLNGAPESACFEILPPHVAQYGGRQVIGWSIWEWPNVFIEAEFHAVWEQPDGTLLDITPKCFEMPRILFLADPSRPYRGRQVDNIRKPLSQDRDIARLCELFSLIHKERNRGQLADYHGPMSDNPITERYDTERRQLWMRLEQRYGRYTTEPI